MAATFTKVTSANTKATRAGKKELKSMPQATLVNTSTGTLRECAENLVALEIDLKEAQTKGYRWHAFPFLPKGGKLGLVVTLYHPDFNLGIENVDENLVALIDGERASIVATRKDDKK